MLKLNASFSKKVPGTQQYSSEGFMASVEVELPDGLNEEQLKEKIHQTFQLVQASVESELNNNGGTVVAAEPVASVKQSEPKQYEAASPKQIKFLKDLVHSYQFDPTEFLRSRGLNSVLELSRKQCSELIDLIKNSHQKAA